MKRKQMQLYAHVSNMLADLVTPVTVYLNLRKEYPMTSLLESNDFRADDNYLSIIGFDTIARIWLENDELHTTGLGAWEAARKIQRHGDLVGFFHEFIYQFDVQNLDQKPPLNGFVGHTNFEAVQHFDTMTFDTAKKRTNIYDLHYILYRNYIVFDHFKDEIFIVENLQQASEASRFSQISDIIHQTPTAGAAFRCLGGEKSNVTDEEFKQMVRAGKEHCFKGDVFQIVLSRQYAQQFKGDDFNVYRVLRSINPSPYLYYFDFGDYKIFGSSPEAQLVVDHREARLNPIAGTYKRSGIDDEDAQKAKALAEDPKEVAEHIMLVDLARNDLGRHCDHVTVKKLKEIQYFSHVIHLVSTVTGKLPEHVSSLRVFGDTFPAGTLSGAPKYKAIELIHKYENQNRSFYGGALGYIGFNGDMNQCIVIRSFLSTNNTLYCQAGAGIVSESNEENELQEVNNKLGALKKAMQQATAI